MEKESNQESDFYKFPTGDTKLRILTDFTQTYALYEGEHPNSKYVKMLTHYEKPGANQSVSSSAWAWADIQGTLKIVKFPYSLMKALSDMSKDPEWEFTNFPMEYDLTVGNTGQGGARYSLRGSPKRSPVAKEVVDALAKKTPCEEIVKKIIDRQGGKVEVKPDPMKPYDKYPDENIDPKDIPF